MIHAVIVTVNFFILVYANFNNINNNNYLKWKKKVQKNLLRFHRHRKVFFSVVIKLFVHYYLFKLSGMKIFKVVH